MQSKKIGIWAWRGKDEDPTDYTLHERVEGGKLRDLMEREYSLNCGVFGNPAYGSWPERALMYQPVKQLVLALMGGRAELLSERPTGVRCECTWDPDLGELYDRDCPVHRDPFGEPYPGGVCCAEYDKSGKHDPECGNAPLPEIPRIGAQVQIPDALKEIA